MPKAIVTEGTGFVGANCPGAKTWQGYRCETQICKICSMTDICGNHHLKLK